MGVFANVMLALFKAIVGFISGSIAIVMDSVNNLSDVLSSVVTIIGTKLSERPADRKHPFGHGRIEYFAAIIIAVLVLMAGIMSLFESVKKIIHPTIPVYTKETLLVIVVAIVVKIFMARYIKRKGIELQSDSLIATGTDAMFDVIITIGTLISAGFMLLLNINLDGILGGLIALAIIKAGISMIAAPSSQLLGRGASKELVETIRTEVMKFSGVRGVHDIMMNYYGPETIVGSFHISVPDTATATEIHVLTSHIVERLSTEYGILATVGIYAINTTGEMSVVQKEVTNYLLSTPEVYSTHGFYYFKDDNSITLDIIPNLEYRNDDHLAERFEANLFYTFPQYTFHVNIDRNYTECPIVD